LRIEFQTKIKLELSPLNIIQSMLDSQFIFSFFDCVIPRIELRTLAGYSSIFLGVSGPTFEGFHENSYLDLNSHFYKHSRLRFVWSIIGGTLFGI
jgi:hypothetical protein